MKLILLTTLTATLLGAGAGYLLFSAIPEGAFVGALIGGSIGLIAALRLASGAAGPVFEYEAEGLHDDNLTTIMRRNLIREAYRDSYDQPAQLPHDRESAR